MTTNAAPAAPSAPKRLEVPQSHDLSLLAPAFRVALEAMLADLRRQGFDPVVFEATRTPDRQHFLYGKGRTRTQLRAVGVDPKWAWPDCPDGRVTKAYSSYRSWHGHGLAVDVISASREWSAPPRFWQALTKAAEKQNLVSGAGWVTMPDKPHVQWGGPDDNLMPDGPDADDRARTAEQGMQATWKFYGADKLPAPAGKPAPAAPTALPRAA